MGGGAAAKEEGQASLEQLVIERYGADVARDARRRWQESLAKADRERLLHFLARGEASPQVPPRTPCKEESKEHVFEFVCKLVFYAPEQWFEVATGHPRPEDAKNDWAHIGVAFDASSRLRRAGIDSYHWRLTERMRGGGRWPAGSAFYVSCDDVRMELCQAGGLPNRAPGVVRVVAVSDTHCFHEHLQLPPGDILIHAGDLSYEESRSLDAQRFEEYAATQRSLSGEGVRSWLESTSLDLKSALEWLGAQGGFGHRLLVGGNHDYILEQLGGSVASELCKSYGIHYLQTSHRPVMLNLSGGRKVTVWGSGVSTCADLSATRAIKSGNCAFQIPQGNLETFLEGDAGHMSEDSADVIVTHTPPAGGLPGKADGAINKLIARVKPSLYVCGHTHNQEDLMKGRWAAVEGAVGVHAACLGQWNHFHGLPIVVDIKPKQSRRSSIMGCIPWPSWRLSRFNR